MVLALVVGGQRREKRKHGKCKLKKIHDDAKEMPESHNHLQLPLKNDK
jgi:hypothetical protein